MRNNYTPPYGGILIVISIVNIIFSTYFISLFLAGVVFKIFLESLKKEYYYLLGFSILTFLVIEVVQGLQPFLLTIIGAFFYYFIIPRIKHTFASAVIAEIIFIFLFYLVIFLATLFYTTFTIDLIYIFGYNFLIDIFIAGFIL